MTLCADGLSKEISPVHTSQRQLTTSLQQSCFSCCQMSKTSTDWNSSSCCFAPGAAQEKKQKANQRRTQIVLFYFFIRLSAQAKRKKKTTNRTRCFKDEQKTETQRWGKCVLTESHTAVMKRWCFWRGGAERKDGNHRSIPPHRQQRVSVLPQRASESEWGRLSN